MMRPHNLRWLLACMSCVAMAARAALPPLPSNMPFDDAIAPAGMPPLPRVITTDVANPFVLDAADDDGASTADAKTPPLEFGQALSAARDDAEPRRKTESEAQKETRQDQQEARHEALEGPPVPLAPAARLSTSASAALPDDRPITLHFQHAELGAVLGAFARFTGLSIVASEKAHGTVTLHLDNVPWRTAFDTLLDVNGLAMEQRGKVIWVAPLSELAARERQRFEAHARAAELEPLASRTFELHYAHADELRKLLTASGNQRVLSKRGAAMADARTNLLFVTDLEARLVQIAELVASLDRPTRQVLIEARIVEAERGFSRNLGVKLSLAAASEDGKATGLVGGKDGAVFDLSARPISGFDAATAGLTLFAAQATRLLNIELSALEAQGRGQIVSSPRVVTADRMKAIVEQGTELPYQAKVGQGVSGVQFRRASLKLEVEPQITPDGRVVLDLDVAKDSVGEQTASGPAINTKHVQTRVEVEDGGTVSIGGIYEADDRDDVTRVPLLGKIPLLGAFFRHRAHRDLTSELVVFITPRVVQTN
ncbi:Type IV pilus secretin PilQ/competence protein [Paraburkholderia piptadeniae]|uniref:Type IV pilus secretin PilQ/competence protein n=1 Tax=Paraburkholderia piptadeniae TaxID=1701573 RepID=A0A1N7SBT4_9BURK|nr:type IV pilus secretin PilQ [Paraburkholderia piptadeniae]SIT44839.1 Type IV pilus secretin PilQ/competence protein [Paraburkholderia piptadeniae]